MGLFSDIGSWINDAWRILSEAVGLAWGALVTATGTLPVSKKVREFVEEKLEEFNEYILQPFVEWVKEQINALIAEIRIWKHELKKELARWLENDLFFLFFLAASIVLIIKLPAIIAWFKDTRVYQLAADLLKKITEKIVKLIDVNKIIDLRLLDQILRVFWDDYNEIMSGWSQAVAALAAELGEGSGYMHAGFAAVRGIVHGYHAVLGLSPQTAEMTFYNDVAIFTKKVDDRFRRYAYDPGLIYVDIMNELLIPAASRLRDANQAQVEQMRYNFNRGLEIENGLKEMQENINALIEWMPNEIERVFAERWQPIDEWLTERFDRIDTYIIPKLLGVIEAFEERVEYQNKINQAALANLQRPDVIASTFWYLSDEAKQAYLDTMSGILIGEDEDARLDDNIYDHYLGGLSRLDAEFEIIGFPALEFEQQGIYHLRGERDVNIPSPFVGDY